MTFEFRGDTSKARYGLPIAVTAVLLTSAALYNRYPLTYWDTHVYLLVAGTLMPHADRPVGYSLFVRAVSFMRTLWPVVLVQAALVSFLLCETYRHLSVNAALTSNLNCVNSRYGVRVAWLMVFSMFAIVAPAARVVAGNGITGWDRRRATSDSSM